MTRHLDIPCPNCRRTLRVREEYLGLQVCCNRCAQPFIARAHETSATPEPEPSASPTDHLGVIRQVRDAQAQLARLQDQVRVLQAQLDRTLGQLHRGVDAPPIRPASAGQAATVSTDGFDPQTDVTMASEADAARHRHLILSTKSDSRVIRPADRAAAGLVPTAGLGAESGDGAAANASRSAELVFPGYQILGTIRDGAMGRVYRARQVSLDRIVAVKMLHAALVRSPDHVERFAREAKLSARLAHPNIIKTIDAGACSGRPYFVLEYVPGKTAQDLLDQRRRLDERAALRVGLAVAEALKHLEERKIVHRDIKPANVLLGDDGSLKLLDFGLARPTDDPAWAAAEEGVAIGTPSFISPEQVRGLCDVDIRSDIYSLGATLYTLATGVVPYDGTTAEVLHQHADPGAAPIPAERRQPGLSAGFAATIARMMTKDRAGRPAHPEALLVELRALARTVLVARPGAAPQPAGGLAR